MRQWEKATWATGQTEAAVIARVGQILARRARQLTRTGARILILAGKGHNGDDARQMLPHLADRQVQLVNVTDALAGLKEVASALTRKPALLVDGLFGIGLDRVLDAPWQRLIEEINQSSVPILAVDVPSGLDADEGQPRGAAIRAAVTLTLGAPKQGLLLPTALPYVGRLEVAADIGLVACPVRSEWQWTLAEDFAGFPPRRPVAGHKGTFGHLIIVAGGVGHHGAAVLAARGAQRAMPGLVTVWTSEGAYLPVAAQLQSVMVRLFPWEKRLPESCTALLIGPGLTGEDLRPDIKVECIRLWQESPLAIVADASALDWLPAGPTPAGAVRVITPHPGEAARMLKGPVAVGLSHRTATLRELARRWGQCSVVLKGHQSLVGSEAGSVFINSSGNPHLAQGGAGDVLAGFLAGWLAQPGAGSDAPAAMRFAVWEHGAAADRLSERRLSWTIEELVEELGNSRAAG